MVLLTIALWVLGVILGVGLIPYYVETFVDGKYKTKQEFLIAFIPFGFWYLQIVKKYKSMPDARDISIKEEINNDSLSKEIDELAKYNN